jgi:prephenate dehydrogenase
VERVDTLAIIGLGLMGGSLGLAVLERGLAQQVVGFDLRADSRRRALKKGAISRAADSLGEAVAGAELVVIATPVGSVADCFIEALPFIREGALVTDLGSTKAGIVDRITVAAPFVDFIGGHPIAGSEEQGIDAATSDLFQGCLWILTPTEHTSPAAYGRLVRFLGSLQARVIPLDPLRHDDALALTSHLPQLLSSTLMGFAEAESLSGEGMPLLTAGGFRDMTRISASSEHMWVEILRENRAAVLGVLRKFQAALEGAAQAVEDGDWERVQNWLAEARRARGRLASKAGVEPAEIVEVRIVVPDRVGVLAEVTTTVGQAGVNIEDLEIVHSAEGGRGVLHLRLTGRAEAELAADAIRNKGYRVEVG